MDVRSPLLAALRPVRGSARLIIMRWLLWILAAAPGVLITMGALGEAVGRTPYFTDKGAPLPFIELTRLIGEIPSIVWTSMLAGAGLAWFGNLLLTAGAVEVLDPETPGPRRVWRATFDTGTRVIWAYLRIALLAFIAIAIGATVIGRVFDRIADHGAIAGWTGKTLLFTVPALRMLILLIWASLVGVFAWWARVIVVADGRRYVRRLFLIIPRLWWRRPIRAVAFHLVVSLSALLLGAIVLTAWRQSSSGRTTWLALHLLALAVQAFIWHWRLRACRLVWARSDLADLRATPDASWRLLGRLRDRFSRKPPVMIAGETGQ